MRRILLPLVRNGLLTLLLCSGWIFAQTVVTLNVNQPAQLQADAGSDAIVCQGDSAQIGAPATGGTPPLTYAWFPTTSLSNPSVANPMAAPGATSDYLVTVTDANNCMSTDTVTITVNVCPGIGNIPPDFSMELYPNPTNGSVTIRLQSDLLNADASIEVFSMLGQEILRFSPEIANGASESKVDLSEHGTGIYFVRLRGDGFVVTRKLIVK